MNRANDPVVKEFLQTLRSQNIQNPDYTEIKRILENGADGRYTDIMQGRSANTKLYATVGLPRSGKSTLCKQLMSYGYVVVNPDNFRLAIHGQRFVISAEPLVWATIYAAVDALLLTGHKIVVDATCITWERREPWHRRGAEFIPMGTTEEECIRRAELIKDDYIVPHIKRMAGNCDWPEAIGK